MDKIEFYIPFEGFYCSIYDDIINGIISNEIKGGYLTEKETENINFTNLHLELSEHIFDIIIEFLNDEFELFTDNDYIKYDGLYSPKYYNYSTDKIKAKCSNEIYLTLLNSFENDIDFVNYVNEVSKSCSGFVSFYEGINEVKKNNQIFLEYLFQWIVLNKYRDDIIELTCDNLHEIIYNNI